MEMKKQKADPYTQNRWKRKREQKNVNRIDKLPDDVLIAILSCMSFKDAIRTSVLSSRWKYLWLFTSGTLEFDDRRNTSSGNIVKVREREEFKTWVNRVLKLHKGRGLDGLVIHFTNLCHQATSTFIDSWIYFAMQKEVKRFELDFSVENGFRCCYKFPDVAKLLSRSHEVKSSVFGSLRSLRLVDVDIEDDVVRYLLASCPYIEHLCIRASHATKNLEVVDPLPNLKELEISDCCNLKSMEISAANLVSCTYQGSKISSPFKKTPNLTELTLGGWFCNSFVYEPDKHSSYSDQLVELVLNFQTVGPERMAASRNLHQLHSLKLLELNIVSIESRSLFFFATLIKASPNLEEFIIKIEYFTSNQLATRGRMELFPDVTSATTSGFHHKNLKVIEMSGYVGLSSEKEFLLQLFKAAPSLDMVFIHTRIDYYLLSSRKNCGTDVNQRTPEWVLRQIRLYTIYSAKELERELKRIRNSPVKFEVT